MCNQLMELAFYHLFQHCEHGPKPRGRVCVNRRAIEATAIREICIPSPLAVVPESDSPESDRRIGRYFFSTEKETCLHSA